MTEQYSDSQMLKYLVDSGKIDKSVVENEIYMNNKQKYLSCHKYKIWKGENDYWYTYLYIGGKRKQVKRSSKVSLENCIAKHYKDNMEDPTIEQLFTMWLDEKFANGEIGRGSVDRYKSDWNRFLKGYKFIHYRISNVTEDDLDEFVRRFIIDFKPTNKRYSNVRSIIIGMFKYAKRRHFTDISVSTFFKDFDISKKLFTEIIIDREKSIYRDDEVAILIDYLKSHPTTQNLCLVLDFQSGIRSGELAALKYTDIKDNVLHIQRQEIVYQEEGKVHSKVHEVVEYTKTEAGNRYIYLPDTSREILRQLRELHPDAEYVYVNKEDKRMNKNTIGKYLKKACEACGIPYRSPHKIRRVYATTLINNNVDDSLLMSQMGHTTTETTRKYYYFADKNNDYKREQINKCIKF